MDRDRTCLMESARQFADLAQQRVDQISEEILRREERKATGTLQPLGDLPSERTVEQAKVKRLDDFEAMLLSNGLLCPRCWIEEREEKEVRPLPDRPHTLWCVNCDCELEC